jgi:hypothetical protein
VDGTDTLSRGDPSPTEFERADLIEIKDRSLTILNPAELRCVADRSRIRIDFAGHRAGLAKANDSLA